MRAQIRKPKQNAISIERDGTVHITSAPRASGLNFEGPADNSPSKLLDTMRRDILAGGFTPNSKLKFEELRGKYQASVGSIREALRHLLSEGLVRSEAYRGFTVAPVSAADLQDITALRIQFERQALADSIARGDDTWESEIVTSLHMLIKLLTNSRDGSKSPDWPTRHKRFHQSLVAACSSPWLLHFRNVLFDQAERYRNLNRVYRAVPRNVAEDHQKLAEIVLARDIPAAQDMGEQHIRATVTSALSSVPGLKAPRRK